MQNQRPSVCNAMEVLLVHEDTRQRFLPSLEKVLVASVRAGPEPIHFRLDSTASRLLAVEQLRTKTLTPKFLHYPAVKVVSSLIGRSLCIVGFSHHSDAIVTENAEAAAYWQIKWDSAVYVNALNAFH